MKSDEKKLVEIEAQVIDERIELNVRVFKVAGLRLANNNALLFIPSTH